MFNRLAFSPELRTRAQWLICVCVFSLSLYLLIKGSIWTLVYTQRLCECVRPGSVKGKHPPVNGAILFWLLRVHTSLDFSLKWTVRTGLAWVRVYDELFSKHANMFNKSLRFERIAFKWSWVDMFASTPQLMLLFSVHFSFAKKLSLAFLRPHWGFLCYVYYSTERVNAKMNCLWETLVM